MIVMKLNPEYFDLIRAGEKAWEVRLNDDKRKVITIGDTIVFKKLPDMLEGVVTKVVDIKYFNTFKDMAETLSLRDIGFDGSDSEEVVDCYHSFYSPQEEEKYHVVAFKLELV